MDLIWFLNKLYMAFKNKFEQFHSQQEAKEKKEYLLRRDLDKEFEEKFGDWSDKLNEAEYQAKKETWIEDRINEAESLEELNDRMEEEIQKNKESKIDRLSGLERREEMYKRMKEKIKEILGIEEEEQLSDEEWLDVFKKQEAENIPQNEYSVMIADVSYLNLVNELGHAKGDKLIEDVGAAFRKTRTRGYRHGGDEFAALLENKQEAREKSQDIKDLFPQQSIGNILKEEFGVEPNIDIGVADFQEALHIFQEMLQNEDVKKEILKKKPLRCFNDVWAGIADKRAQMSKARERMAILADMYKKDRENYNKIITFLRKGAYGITNEEVAALSEAENRKQEIEKLIWEKQQQRRENLIKKKPQDDSEKLNILEEVQILKTNGIK